MRKIFAPLAAALLLLIVPMAAGADVTINFPTGADWAITGSAPAGGHVSVPDGTTIKVTPSGTADTGSGGTGGGTDTGGGTSGGTSGTGQPTADNASWCPADQYNLCVGLADQTQVLMRDPANAGITDWKIRFQPGVHKTRVQFASGNIVADMTGVTIDCNGVQPEPASNGIQARGCVTANGGTNGVQSLKITGGVIDASTIPGDNGIRGLALFQDTELVGTKFAGCVHACIQGNANYNLTLDNVDMERCALSGTVTRHCIYTAPGDNPGIMTITNSRIGVGMVAGDTVKSCQKQTIIKGSTITGATGDAGALINAKCNWDVAVEDSTLYQPNSAGNYRLFATDSGGVCQTVQKAHWTFKNTKIVSDVPGSFKMYCYDPANTTAQVPWFFAEDLGGNSYVEQGVAKSITDITGWQ